MQLDLRGLGSQINAHGSNCGGKPVVVLSGCTKGRNKIKRAAESIEAPSETQPSPDFRCSKFGPAPEATTGRIWAQIYFSHQTPARLMEP